MPDAPKWNETEAEGMSLASASIMICLLEELVAKGILSTDDVRGILQRASNGVANFYGNEIGREAGRVIASLLSRFTEIQPK